MRKDNSKNQENCDYEDSTYVKWRGQLTLLDSENLQYL